MCLAEPQTCINLKRIARSNAVINGDNNHLRKQFPRLFSCETGRMNYLYDIQLNHDSQPVSSGFGQRRGKTKVIITNPPTTKPLNPKTDHTTNKDHANTADKYLT